MSAAEVRRKYNIGWERLQKIWGNGDKDIQVLKPSGEIKRLEAPAKEESLNPGDFIKREQLVVEDFYSRLADMQELMKKQSEKIQYLIDLLQDNEDCEDEKREPLGDLSNKIQEYITLSKTIVYCALTGLAVWRLYCKTAQNVEFSKPVASIPQPPPQPQRAVYDNPFGD